jgi:hypothetical protein
MEKSGTWLSEAALDKGEVRAQGTRRRAQDQKALIKKALRKIPGRPS